MATRRLLALGVGDHPTRSVYADSVLFGGLTESGARKILLADSILSTSTASVVRNLANWVRYLILVTDSVDPVLSVLMCGGI